LNTDALYGAIFTLVMLNVLNSVILIAMLSVVVYQQRILVTTLDQLKNWLVAQDRRRARIDK